MEWVCVAPTCWFYLQASNIPSIVWCFQLHVRYPNLRHTPSPVQIIATKRSRPTKPHGLHGASTTDIRVGVNLWWNPCLCWLSDCGWWIPGVLLQKTFFFGLNPACSWQFSLDSHFCSWIPPCWWLKWSEILLVKSVYFLNVYLYLCCLKYSVNHDFSTSHLKSLIPAFKLFLVNSCCFRPQTLSCSARPTRISSGEDSFFYWWVASRHWHARGPQEVRARFEAESVGASKFTANVDITYRWGEIHHELIRNLHHIDGGKPWENPWKPMQYPPTLR